MITQQIQHHSRRLHGDISRPHSADGAQLLFKLAAATGVDRQVAAVVRARRDFVDEQLPVAAGKEFHTQDANDVEVFQNAACDLLSIQRLTIRNQWRGTDRNIENMVLMVIQHGREKTAGSVRKP